MPTADGYAFRNAFDKFLRSPTGIAFAKKTMLTWREVDDGQTLELYLKASKEKEHTFWGMAQGWAMARGVWCK